MKKIIILVGVMAFIFTSCGQSKTALKNEQDSVAYALGMGYGQQFKQFDSTIDIDMLARAMKDVIANKELPMDEMQSQQFLQNYFMVVKPAKTLKESEEFIANVEKQANVQKTESGLLYEILTPGDESVKASNPADVVKVHYKGMLKNGSEFDSSGTDTVQFPVGNVIRGWGEGVQLVGKGGKIKLWVPSDLAYGAQGNQRIQPNEALVFEIDLLDVVPADTTAVTLGQ